MKFSFPVVTICLCLVLISSSYTAAAQSTSPYRLTWKKEGIILGGSLALGFVDLRLRDIDPLTQSDLLMLNADNVNRFDRRAIDNYSEAAALRSDIGWYLSIASGAGMAIGAPLANQKTEGASKWKEIGTLGLLWTEQNIITGLGTDLVKNIVLRPRPFTYGDSAPFEEKLDPDARKSFFSGHTSLTTCNAWFAAKVYSDYFPESKWKPLVWGLAVTVPAWVGLERVLAGKHYPTDVITGYAFGAAVGYLIPAIHQDGGLFRRHQAGMSFQLYPVATFSGNGLGLNISF